ncbi:MAG: diguanylate cyclase [Thermomicrobiales bacterium]|jgi:diguanylate cyclase (GGDEF)-like protein|nr:diguanylate cyclase [Thermomicrobiales bacterium]
MPPSTSLIWNDSSITSHAARQTAPAAKVLIVDRDPDVVERLRSVVGAAGYPTVGATTATQALALIKSQGCQMVILDREMPEIDGLVLCAAIRAARTLPGYVYIILRSDQASEKDILIGLHAEADDYVSKDMPVSQLIARLMTAQRILALEHGLRTTLEERTHWALTDSLTGVRNRRCFDLELSRELKIARRYGGDLSLIVIDVDYFKAVNDQHGHAVGDEVLRAVARRLEGLLPRDTDWLARIGGEEFAAVLPQTRLQGAVKVAETIRSGIEAQPMTTQAGPISITVSLGVSGTQQLETPEASPEELLRRADACLYRSKHDGRNRVTVDQA